MRGRGMFLALGLILLTGCRPSGDQAATPTNPRTSEKLARMIEESTPQRAKGGPGNSADVVPPPPPAFRPAAAVPQASAAVDPSSLKIIEVDGAGFDKDLARHQGKTLVVDCWATWCTTCKSKFPNYVELSEKYKGRTDVVFANVANDESDKIDSIREFLAMAGPELVHYRLEMDPAEFAEKFQVDGIPAYLVYSPKGEIVFRTNKVDELATRLEEMLR